MNWRTIDENQVTRRERYFVRFSFPHLGRILGARSVHPLIHRTDYFEDGSQAETYCVELTEQEYRKLTVYGEAA